MVVKKLSDLGLLLGTRSSECLGLYCSRTRNDIYGCISVLGHLA